MQIKCDQCNAVFNIDESKVPEEGARAKCTKCGSTIIIQRKTTVEKLTCLKCGSARNAGEAECANCLSIIETRNNQKKTELDIDTQPHTNTTNVASMTSAARVGYFVLIYVVIIFLAALFSLLLVPFFTGFLPTAGIAFGIGWIGNYKDSRLSLSRTSYLFVCIKYLLFATIIAVFFNTRLERIGTPDDLNLVQPFVLIALIIIAYFVTKREIKKNKHSLL